VGKEELVWRVKCPHAMPHTRKGGGWEKNSSILGGGGLRQTSCTFVHTFMDFFFFFWLNNSKMVHFNPTG
jgi:hypothetical protein